MCYNWIYQLGYDKSKNEEYKKTLNSFVVCLKNK